MVPIKEGERVLVIFGSSTGKMIHVADGVVISDNIHHRAVNTNLCQARDGFLVGNARVNADRHAKFTPHAYQVGDIFEEWNTSLFITAAGDQHATRALARQFAAHLEKRAARPGQSRHALENA